jgi:hypothetical protein
MGAMGNAWSLNQPGALGSRATYTPRPAPQLRHEALGAEAGFIATLATVLGPANINTTTRYLHPTARRVQEPVCSAVPGMVEER